MLTLLERIPSDIRKQMQDVPAKMTCRPTDFPTDKINAMVLEISNIGYSKTSEIDDEMLQILFKWGFCRDPNAESVLYLKTDYYCIVIVLPDETSDGYFHFASYHYTVSNFTNGKITATIGTGDDATTICFPCLEAAFQVMKAVYANDMDAILKIFQAETPGKCKEAGGDIKFSKEGLAEWDQAAPSVMEALLVEKIKQNVNVEHFFQSIERFANVFEIPLTNIKFPEANIKGGKWGTGLNVGGTLEAIIAGNPYPTESLFEHCIGKALMLTVYAEDINPQSPKKARRSPTQPSEKPEDKAPDDKTPDDKAPDDECDPIDVREGSFVMVHSPLQ